jgi:hypothetical protein
MGVMALELRGREIWWDGLLIATIRDEYSVDEWLWRFDPGQPRPPLPPAVDEGVIEDQCAGCSWPGRCKAYGSEGCRMKAEERLQVESDRG